MRLLILITVLVCCAPLHAAPPTPTHKDVAYDSQHKAQVLDVYVAKSETPLPVVVYIHGGGWRAGSKNRIPRFLQDGLQAGRFSVVSVEYRFTDVAPHPAQVNDCFRAIQFVRHKAKDWGIDAAKMGVTGGSAGGHLSLYMALHDDKANPGSDDPVARQSTRVACAVGWAGPTDWTLLDSVEHKHPAYRQLIGYEPGTPADKMDAEKKTSVSPITFASADDPPVLIVHGTADVIVPMAHAEALHKKLQEVKGKTELFAIEKARHNVAGAGHPEAVKRANEFFAKHLKLK
jgi:acetyl esterase/lipase